MSTLRMTREVDPRPDIQEYANYNVCYSIWLAKVDSLCNRLLNIDLMQIIESDGLDPWDDWESGWSPERFFSGTLITHCVNEQGADFIDEVIGLEAMWGASSP